MPSPARAPVSHRGSEGTNRGATASPLKGIIHAGSSTIKVMRLDYLPGYSWGGQAAASHDVEGHGDLLASGG